MSHSVLLLTRYERKGPSSRVRHYNFLPALERAGFRVTSAPLLDNEYLDRFFGGGGQSTQLLIKAYWRRLRQILTARRYDLIWIEKEALPWLPAAFERAFFGERPLVIDFDDPWHLRYAGHWNALARAVLGRKLEAVVARATVVTAGSPALASWARSSHASRVVEMMPTVDIEHYPILPPPEGPFTIGWIGTPTNIDYLASIAGPLRHLHATFGARLRLIGGRSSFSLPGVLIDHIAWREDTEAQELARCHVGIMPLVDGPWERGKCGYKLIQYMAAARPAVASPVGASASMIVHGKTGFLAGNAEEWIAVLSALAADRELVRTLGLAARRHAEEVYSLQRAEFKLIELFQDAISSTAHSRNIDAATVAGFGREWRIFPQSASELSAHERRSMFDSYFDIFPWDSLPPNSVGMDVGCGSGRWATLAAPRVGHLHLVDASKEAISVAKANLADVANVSFHVASVVDLPVGDSSLDFAYALGVLHHVPDTERAVQCIARKLKPGAPLLVYLYYAFENRPVWYRWLWRVSNAFRIVLSRSPERLRYLASQAIAGVVYWPLARVASLLDAIGMLPRSTPLLFYKDRSFYVMRTDAYDRFCTPLEKRFKKEEVRKMLAAAGIENIAFSDHVPFWCAVGRRGLQ
jgi:ubiquinone/menaquinone biosynthesis C-methylase UbiE/glycosyltransferase involved in cell wall biosynthesis